MTHIPHDPTIVDRNRDGRISPPELQADIRRPDLFYSDRMRIDLGGKTVELVHPVEST